MALTPEIEQILTRVDEALERHPLRVERIRLLAGTEEIYRLIMREIDRVKAQRQRAVARKAAATLTLKEWFTILDRYGWKCAWCREKPFQIMSHVVTNDRGGTTAENCVPACHSCLQKRLH